MTEITDTLRIIFEMAASLLEVFDVLKPACVFRHSCAVRHRQHLPDVMTIEILAGRQMRGKLTGRRLYQ